MEYTNSVESILTEQTQTLRGVVVDEFNSLLNSIAITDKYVKKGDRRVDNAAIISLFFINAKYEMRFDQFFAKETLSKFRESIDSDEHVRNFVDDLANIVATTITLLDTSISDLVSKVSYGVSYNHSNTLDNNLVCKDKRIIVASSIDDNGAVLLHNNFWAVVIILILMYFDDLNFNDLITRA